MPRRFDACKFDLDRLKATAGECKNRGRWDPDDGVGALEFISPRAIADAPRRIRRRDVFSLGSNFDRSGPQRGLSGNRCNPIHALFVAGTDVASGNQDGVYDTLFCAPPVPISGAFGWPSNSAGHRVMPLCSGGPL